MSLFGPIIAIVLGGLLFTWLERSFPADQAKRWWRRPLLTDLLYVTIDPIISKLVVAGISIAAVLVVVAVLAVPIDQSLLHRLSHPDSAVAALPRWMQIPLALLAADVASYWFHRASHRIPWLWALHSIHHSSEQLDWFSSLRNHPIGQALGLLWIGAALLILGFPLRVLEAIAPLLGVLGVLGHANVRWEWGPGWRWVFSSPTFHRWHHTTVDEGGDRNFAAFFPFIDRMFGTAYLPPGQIPQRFGVAGEGPPHSYLGQLWHPFRIWFGDPLPHPEANEGNSMRRWRWGRFICVVTVLGVVLSAVWVAKQGEVVRLGLIQSLPITKEGITWTSLGPPRAPEPAELRLSLPVADLRRVIAETNGKHLPPQALRDGDALIGTATLPTAGGETRPLAVVFLLDDRVQRPELAVHVPAKWLAEWVVAGTAKPNPDGGHLRIDPGWTCVDVPPVAGWDRRVALRGSATASGPKGQLLIPSFTLVADFAGQADRTGIGLRLHIGIEDLRVGAGAGVAVPTWLTTWLLQDANRRLAAQLTRIPCQLPAGTTVRIAPDSASGNDRLHGGTAPPVSLAPLAPPPRSASWPPQPIEAKQNSGRTTGIKAGLVAVPQQQLLIRRRAKHTPPRP